MGRAKKNKKVNPEFILTLICDRNKITREEIFSKSRKPYLVDARQMFFYLCYIYTNSSLNKICCISEEYGRDEPYNHATIIHAYKKPMGLYDIYKDVKEEIDYYDKEIEYKCSSVSNVIVQDFNLLGNLKKDEYSIVDGLIVKEFNLLDILETARICEN